MRIKTWLIHKLGGVTMEDNVRQWEAVLAQLKAEKTVTVIDGSGPVLQPHVQGALITTPASYTSIIGGYFEGRLNN